ncbi:hypothetical protein ACVWXP_001964 [Bradyrhizobium sp. USDA 4463]
MENAARSIVNSTSWRVSLSCKQWGETMRAFNEQLETRRIEAIECALIRDLSTDRRKREFFAKLADQLTQLADDVEGAIEESTRLPLSRPGC